MTEVKDIIHPSIRFGIANTGSYIRLSKRDKNVFDITKVRTKWTCIICEKEIDEGSFIIGSGYVKVCLGCAEKFLSDIENSFSEKAELIKQIKLELENNKEKYEKNNMLARIKTGNIC